MFHGNIKSVSSDIAKLKECETCGRLQNIVSVITAKSRFAIFVCHLQSSDAGAA